MYNIVARSCLLQCRTHTHYPGGPRGFLFSSGHPGVVYTPRPIVRGYIHRCGRCGWVWVCERQWGRKNMHEIDSPRTILQYTIRVIYTVQMSNLLQQFLLHRHLLLNNIFFSFPSILSFFDMKPTTQAAAAAALLYTWMYIIRDRRTDDVRKFDCRPPRCGKHIIIYTQYI